MSENQIATSVFVIFVILSLGHIYDWNLKGKIK